MKMPNGEVERLCEENKRLRAVQELREQFGAVYNPVNQREAQYRAEARE